MAGLTPGDRPVKATNGAIEGLEELSGPGVATGDGRPRPARDQTLADADQTAADSDQTAADSDQTAADSDQAAAETDQAASDRDLVHGGDPGVHSFTRDLRDRSTHQRQHGAERRSDAAADRDGSAHTRDLAALARDETADMHDRELAARDAGGSLDGGPAITGRASKQRKRAAHDRATAAEGRARAAVDREQAARDRAQAAGDRERAREDHDALLAHLATVTADHRADRAAAAEALRESEERYRLLAENSTDVIMRMSSEGKVRYVSPSSRSVFGYQPEEMVGHADLRGVHPEDLVAVRGAAVALIAGSDGTATCEFRARRKDGSYVWVESRTRRLSSPVSVEGDEFQSAVRDIGERKDAEAETKRAHEETERANRAKTDFLSSMSHELRTPLNAVLGFTGTLLMGLHGPLAEEQITQLRTVERAGRHLLYLISSLLDLARVESQQIDPHLEPFECQALLDEVAAELRPLADEKGLELEVLSGSEPIELMCDRLAVIRILINLTDNAIKFTDEGSVRLKVDRRFTADGFVTRFAVIDTGCGIAPEVEQELSAVFAQSGAADARSLHASGLGLYVSQSLARLIEARITVENAPGEGSTFALEMSGRAS